MGTVARKLSDLYTNQILSTTQKKIIAKKSRKT